MNETKMKKQVIKAVPLGERSLPKHKARLKPIKGENTKAKYIVIYLSFH